MTAGTPSAAMNLAAGLRSRVRRKLSPSTTGNNLIGDFDSVNTRKIAASAMISAPRNALDVRATKMPMKTRTTMPAPAPFLWVKKPRQLPARSGSARSVALVDRELGQEYDPGIAEQENDQGSDRQQPAEVISPLRHQQEYRRLKDREGGKNQFARGQSRIQRKGRRACKPQERQDEYRRQRLANDIGPLDEDEGPQGQRHQDCEKLTDEVSLAIRLEQLRVRQIGKWRGRQPDEQKCREKEHVARQTLAPAGGKRLRGR